MSTSIYSVPAWAAATNYLLHDIVSNSSKYYYAKQDHTSLSSFTSELVNGRWGGMTTDDNGQPSPHFIWTPSYNSTNENAPRVKKIQFGDGYQQRVADGINNILLQLDLTFDTRDTAEATAILHFLHTRAGVESFIYTPPPPYGKAKKFVCAQWNDSRNFYNNITIKARFEEVVA